MDLDCSKIASVIFSGAGPPFPILYLMPKSSCGPPGLWLAERMIPPNALYLRMMWEAAGVDNGELFDGFAHRVALSLRWIRETLHGLKAAGHSVVAYGAAAKGAMLLNAAGIDGDILDFVADRNPAKQGLYMPGVHVPIVPPSAIAERRPDYVLLLSWNLAEEIFSQQREYVEAGGRFVVPLPKPGFYPPDSV